MQKILVALTVIMLIGGLSFAHASNWSGNPLDKLDKQADNNVSYPLDFNKNKVISQKSYGWQVSKVCGLDLCVKGSSGFKQPSYLKNEQMAPQTLKPYLGLNPFNGGLSFSIDDFDGKFYIKGFFK